MAAKVPMRSLRLFQVPSMVSGTRKVVRSTSQRFSPSTVRA